MTNQTETTTRELSLDDLARVSGAGLPKHPDFTGSPDEASLLPKRPH